MMNQDSVFNAARQISDPAEREEYLLAACADDVQALRRIRELLSLHEDGTEFFESPPEAQAATQSLTSPDQQFGEMIGSYKLLQQIGEGGMGTVYMAEQQAPVVRRVALKVIKPGMDSKQVIARFEAERQALAMMDHPNIARVLDVGATEAGRPYFVMELVKGVPITKFCDERRLGLRARLELFTEVCGAVQHAHQKGIIHRDIKPSNVLVAEYDDKFAPKIIDFGLAKALSQRLTDKTMFTQLGQVVGTLEYMSPEQSKMNQLDVDTRSDIYSLGVLLYELLTGSPPFDRERLRSVAFEEVLRIIREEEPPRPSARLSSSGSAPAVPGDRRIESRRLSGMMRGELDWIVMKALEKDRRRRYETANGLALDVVRYLNDDPVVACPPSVLYRFRKLCRRHRVAFLVCASIGLALIVGLLGTGWQAIRATIAEGKLGKKIGEVEAAKLEADKAKDKAEETLFDMYTSFGLLAAERDDAAGAALWFASAAAASRPNSNADRDSRIRVQSWARIAPSPVRVLGKAPAERPQSSDRLSKVQFDVTGQRLVTLTHGGRCTVWSVFGNTAVDLPDRITSLAWRPQRSELAVAVTGGVKILTAPSWNSQLEIPFEGDVSAIGFSADGSALAVASDEVRVWSLADHRFVTRAWQHPAAVRSVQFSPDGRRLLTQCEDDYARLFEVAQDTEGPSHARMFHRGTIFRERPLVEPRFVGEGRGIIAATSGRAFWHDIATGKMLREIRLDGPAINLIPTSPDQSHFAICGGGNNWIWNAAAESQVGEGIKGNVVAAAFAPDGSEIAMGFQDGLVRRFSTRDGAESGASLPPLGPIDHLEYSPGGRHLACGATSGAVYVWLLNGPQGTHNTADSGSRSVDIRLRHVSLAAGSTDLKLSSSGAYLLPSGSNWFWGKLRRTRVYDAISLLPAGPEIDPRFLLLDAALSPDEKHLVTASRNKELTIWDWRTGKPRRAPISLDSEPTCVEYLPDGEHVVVLCADGRIEAVNPMTGAKRYEVQHGDGQTPAFSKRESENFYVNASGSPTGALDDYQLLTSSDGQWLVTVGVDHTARVWTAATGEPRYAPLDHDAKAHQAALAPDGAVLATVSLSVVRFWDFRSGRPLPPSLEHPQPVSCVSFSPDGKHVLTGCADSKVRLWDWRSGVEASPPMETAGKVQCVEFAGPDGEWLVTAAGGIRNLQLWNHGGRLLMPPFPLSSEPRRILRRDGNPRILVSGGARGEPRIDSVPLGDLIDSGSLTRDDLARWVEVLSGKRIQAGVSVGLGERRWIDQFQSLRARQADLLPQDWPSGDVSEWHEQQVREAAGREDWFAANWHLHGLIDRLGESDWKVVRSKFELAAQHADALLKQDDLPGAIHQVQQALAENDLAPLFAKHNFVLNKAFATLRLVATRAKIAGRAEAKQISQQTLALLEQKYGTDSAETLSALEWPAQVDASDVDLGEDAIQRVRGIVEVRRQVLGPGHAETVRALQALMRMLSGVGHGAEALTVGEQVLKLQVGSLGAQAPETLETLRGLVDIYRSQGLNEQAFERMREYLARRREVFGEADQTTLRERYALCHWLALSGKPDEARSELTEVVAAMRATFAAPDMITLSAMRELARINSQLGSGDEAIRIMQEVVEALKKVNPDHRDFRTALEYLRSLLVRDSQLDNAKLIDLELLQLYRGDQDGSRTIAVMQHLASLNMELGLPAEAIGQLREAVETSARLLGEDSWDRFVSMRLLGSCLWQNHQYQPAIQQFSELVQQMPEQRRANSWPFKNELARMLANCPEPGLRDPKRAVELGEELTAARPQTASYWNTLGVAKYRNRDWPGAITALTKSAELAKEQGLALDAFFLAMAHWQQGDKELAAQWHRRARQWMKANAAEDEELKRFQQETAELLESPGK